MNPSLVQLRSTAFIPVVITYNEENRSRFANLLPDSQVMEIMPQSPNTIIQSGITLGAPFQYVKYNRSIMFNGHRVDIVETRQNEQIASEKDFVDFCIDVFTKIIPEVGCYTRFAYAPLMAVDEIDGFNCNLWWNKILKGTTQEGLPMQEINVTFLLKKNILINEKEITLNLHHNLYDGYRFDSKGDKINDSILAAFDINTLEKNNLSFKNDDVVSFFEIALKEKDILLDNYFAL